MNDLTQHNQIIAKIQHFADSLRLHESERENILLTLSDTGCDKLKLKHQILLCQELSKEYYQMFDDILYK
jgi:hypothetical protein